uniref:Uncharacterized protein n=1 Tax=Anguilla anguilla TaxID=7936 RepID=A0A0E9UZ39_ANGAN
MKIFRFEQETFNQQYWKRFYEVIFKRHK